MFCVMAKFQVLADTFPALIERVSERAQVKHDALAALQSIQPAQWRRQRTLDEHMSLPGLCLMENDRDGRRFLQALWLELSERWGVGEDDALKAEKHAAREAFMRLVDQVQVRMLRADLRREKRTERKVS